MNILTDNNQHEYSNGRLEDKIKEYSSIIHTMRHDLRNFVAAIEGFSYLLKEEYDPEYLNRIFANINSVNDLIDRVVILIDSDLEIENSSSIDLNIIASSYRKNIPDNIKYIIDKLPIVSGDFAKIQLVFKSILDNALEHGKPNLIEIKALKKNTECFSIKILNDGKKISEEGQKNLFKKTPQSLKPKGGLSLIIVQKLLQAHKWDIFYVEEQDDKIGFEILIPSSSISS